MIVYLDEGVSPGIGDHVHVKVLGKNGHQAEVDGVVTGIQLSRRNQHRTQTIEILDFGNDRYEYWEILYDRIPSLPQSLRRDFGIIPHLWQNIAHRVARTRK
jgi:cellulose synthase (UDP-forming)